MSNFKTLYANIYINDGFENWINNLTTILEFCHKALFAAKVTVNSV